MALTPALDEHYSSQRSRRRRSLGSGESSNLRPGRLALSQLVDWRASRLALASLLPHAGAGVWRAEHGRVLVASMKGTPPRQSPHLETYYAQGWQGLQVCAPGEHESYEAGGLTCLLQVGLST